MPPLLLAAACNTAPLWPDDAIAPGGHAPWAAPSDDACEDFEDRIEIDGFALCGVGRAITKTPVDDPIYAGCDSDLGADREVVSLFDGARARAYPVDLLIGRELVNTDWDGEPVLVDY